MKETIISIVVVLIITIVTVCASYYFVTKYNIEKENQNIFNSVVSE